MGGANKSGEAVAETEARAVLMPKEMTFSLIECSSAFRRMVFSAFAKRMQTIMHLLERVAFQKVRRDWPPICWNTRVTQATCT